MSGYWYADLAFRLLIVALLALGIVKVCDIVDWWATRKTRRVMVQTLVIPEGLEDVNPQSGLYGSARNEELWQDCPALNRVNLAYHQQRFPGARYRLVRLGEDD